MGTGVTHGVPWQVGDAPGGRGRSSRLGGAEMGGRLPAAAVRSFRCREPDVRRPGGPASGPDSPARDPAMGTRHQPLRLLWAARGRVHRNRRGRAEDTAARPRRRHIRGSATHPEGRTGGDASGPVRAADRRGAGTGSPARSRTLGAGMDDQAPLGEPLVWIGKAHQSPDLRPRGNQHCNRGCWAGTQLRAGIPQHRFPQVTDSPHPERRYGSRGRGDPSRPGSVT